MDAFDLLHSVIARTHPLFLMGLSGSAFWVYARDKSVKMADTRGRGDMEEQK